MKQNHPQASVTTCATRGDVARRLWKALIILGDVPNTAPEPDFRSADGHWRIYSLSNSCFVYSFFLFSCM